jgi:hypothetical protein
VVQQDLMVHLVLLVLYLLLLLHFQLIPGLLMLLEVLLSQ